MERRPGPKGPAALDRLIGRWSFEASVEGRLLGRGWTTFERMEDAFVLQRADDEPGPDTAQEWATHSPMPVTSILGGDDSTDELVMLYSDARGVFRVYRMRLTDEAWTIWRDAPGFNQRYVGTFTDEATVQGRWETSRDGKTWEPDFDLIYRKEDLRRKP
jgi:hypothetical protein